MLRKGEKIVVSQRMLKIVIEWYHDKFNHPKVSALIKSIKLVRKSVQALEYPPPPPSGVTEKLRLSPDDFVYQPVNSKWRAMKCKEVLDNQVNFPLHIDINDIDSRFDLRKAIVKCKIPIIPDGIASSEH